MTDYCTALRKRFSNPRIEHRLHQISSDGLAKVLVRIAPTARLERQQGRSADGAARGIAAWIVAVRSGVAAPDSRVEELRRALDGSDATLALIAALGHDLAADRELVDQVRAHVIRLGC